MKISIKWMVLIALLSASVACGESIDKKMPVVESGNNTANNINNVDDVDDSSDDPDDNNDAPDVTNNQNNVDPANNANHDGPTNNVNNDGPTNNTNNDGPTNNLNNTNNDGPTNNDNNVNNVNPDEYRPIHVQLVWTTAADGDQTDATGTDLDIHVAHPLAAMDPNQPDRDLDGARDPWFHDVYDCSWRNAAPDWGSAGQQHDPSQDIDDTDGAGPENINIEQPENVDYRVAAHYYSDNGLGQSVATVKIFVGGQLVAELDNALNNKDLWEAATIDGRTGAVTMVGKLSQNYREGAL